MANMGGLSEQSEEDEEKELRQAFTVRLQNIRAILHLNIKNIFFFHRETRGISAEFTFIFENKLENIV
jgi:hypothetical protein